MYVLHIAYNYTTNSLNAINCFFFQLGFKIALKKYLWSNLLLNEEHLMIV